MATHDPLWQRQYARARDWWALVDGLELQRRTLEQALFELDQRLDEEADGWVATQQLLASKEVGRARLEAVLRRLEKEMRDAVSFTESLCVWAWGVRRGGAYRFINVGADCEFVVAHMRTVVRPALPGCFVCSSAEEAGCARALLHDKTTVIPVNTNVVHMQAWRASRR